MQLMENGEVLAVSLAPSFVSYFNEWEQKRLPSALRMLGFKYVGETAIGAWHTALATADYIRNNPGKPHICTACPAMVNYVRHEMPKMSKYLVPVVSPMVAHARLIKSQYPGIKVVFIGPCVAKKEEAQWTKNEPFIDSVLTYEELNELFRLKNIRFESCEESAFDEVVPGDARVFPLEGGLLRTAGLKTDMLDSEVIAISGYREIKEALTNLPEMEHGSIILEPLFCKNGCINGPMMNRDCSFINRSKVLHYAAENPGTEKSLLELYAKMETGNWPEVNIQKSTFTEEQIKEVLLKTGKIEPSDELNCTACGYPTCRDKAIAVLENLAELEMCMPHMRRLAEQKMDTIIDRDPNGIVLLSHELEILHMNPAFKKMFACSDALIGKKISYLIDPVQFEKLIAGKEGVLRQDVQYSNYGMVCHLIAYAMPEENQVVGVFVDITDVKSNKDKLTEIKSETVHKAQELIDHQINMAQELARFLGENTARGEVLMKNLIDSIKK